MNTMSDEFAHPAERALAREFDRLGIEWQYEPHTFVLERRDGQILEACTPDFYLPDLDLYLECTVQRRKLHRKNRKMRKVRQRFGVDLGVLYRRDLLRLARTYGLDELETAVG
jgi:hypoxanthine phosphoribosyltransferase